MMRHRKRSKIKLQHGLIAGLESFLQKIELWPEIDAINPGRIKPKRKGSPFAIRIQYCTKSGLKCIARSQGVQEVFFVSSDPKKLEEHLKKMSKHKILYNKKYESLT
tara:strand:+ start:13702 stop:14022 length:321 start_codon:yes stop_codon:yes gene_type:complete